MAFNIPVQTSFTPLKPTTLASNWVRPSDWITITDAPNIIQFLVSDIMYPAYNIQTTFTQTGGVGNIYIDWGDGVVNTISTTTTTSTEHVYSGGGSTYSTQGYNTWKITISGDSGTRITAASFFNPNYWGSSNQYQSGLLEEYYGDNTITTVGALHYAATSKPFFYNLVYSKLPSVITGAGTSLQNAYVGCNALIKIVMPTSMSGLSAMDSFVSGCNSLQSITIPQDATGITNMSSSFNSCYALTGITLPPTLNSVNNMTSTFLNCYSLRNVILPATPNNANYAGTFGACYNLISMEIQTFGTAASISTNAMFSTCYSLEYVKLPTTVSGGSVFDLGNMFNSCRALKSCIFPTNINASSMATTFQNCFSLTYVSLPTSMPSLTSLQGTFNACSDLPDVTLPTTVGSTIDISNLFVNCGTLSTAIIPSSYVITSMANTFSNCFNLVSVTLPTGAQNSLTSLSATFNTCYNLKSVTLPSSMTLLNTVASAFNNCYSLTGVTYPSALNAVTTAGNWHTNNYNLLSATLPTSMSACNTWAGAFNACYKLQSIIMPATILNTTQSFLNFFLNNYSLKSCVLPTTQTTALIAAGAGATSMFQNCYSLTGLTNTDKLGQNATTGATFADFTNFGALNYELTGSYTFASKMSKFTMTGTATRLSKVSGLRFTNPTSGGTQWGGLSPQIDISYTSLSTAALNTLFADIAAQGTVTSKTINITGAVGAAGLSAGDRLILTSKGWTITG
jgi:hypothetical protein